MPRSTQSNCTNCRCWHDQSLQTNTQLNTQHLEESIHSKLRDAYDQPLPIHMLNHHRYQRIDAHTACAASESCTQITQCKY